MLNCWNCRTDRLGSGKAWSFSQ